MELKGALRMKNRACRVLCGVSILLAGLIYLAVAVYQPFYPQEGDKTLDGGNAVADVTNKNLGYIRIKHSATKKRLKVRMTKDGVTLTYDLNSEGLYEVYPFQLGDGTYVVTVYKQLSGNDYTTVVRWNVKVALTDPLSPFLCPNQYIWYHEDDDAVAVARDICGGMDDQSKCLAVLDYIAKHVKYDFFSAMKVESTYLPEPDQTLQKGKGICFDYAALMCAMLRSQGVPAKLMIGYADKMYHAWVNAYVGDAWVQYDPTFESTGNKANTYTVERWY